MRTPGADRELAAGFLLSERVLKHADDLGTIEHCRDVRETSGVVDSGERSAQSRTAENVINVTLTGQSRQGLEKALAAKRQTMTSSSCGLCGRLTIDSLREDIDAARSTTTDGGIRVSAAVISCLPDRLRQAQAVFDETGGLHAAGLFTPDGTLVAMAEDVGRHNAVDKVIGRMLMQDALPLSKHVLCVSGRTSFEIVQKALFAGVTVVAAVSAPSSLAIDLASELGVTLIGFVRGDGFNIYAHQERIA
jgi:FdhD protein